MKIYFFGIEHEMLDEVYESGFDGGLFLYNAGHDDQFTILISNKDKLKKDFNYMVAIRPYTISPQYLSMIHRSVSKIMPGRLEINLISGDPKEIEKPYNSFVGETNDSSTKIEKSKYLMEYLEALNWLRENCPDPNREVPNAYVSTTNEFVLEVASRYHHKMIIPYPTYKKWKQDGTFNKVNKVSPINFGDIFVSMAPVIMFPDDVPGTVPKTRTSDGIRMTAEAFVKELQKLKNEGLNGIFTASWEDTRSRLIRFVKENKDLI